MIQKSFHDVYLHITDEEYFNDGCIHHSTLSTFAKSGFEGLKHLFDFKGNDATVKGSMLDCYMFEGQEGFDKLYVVADMPTVSFEMANMIKALYNLYGEAHASLNDISDVIISETMLSAGMYVNNWGAAARAKRLREVGTDYYSLLHIAEGKTIVSTEMYNETLRMAEALRTSPATAYFFQPDNPFENIERISQAVFRETIDGITYSIKPDLLLVDHDNKRIICTDLKTTGKPEYKFYYSFLDFSYHAQSNLYYYVMRQALDRDEYFKDFEMTNWFFLVVNKDSCTPLVWEDEDTKVKGSIFYGKNKQIEVKDPFEVAKELKYYLDNQPKVPIGINLDKPNSIKDTLNKL